MPGRLALLALAPILTFGRAAAQVPDAAPQFVRIAAMSAWIDPTHPLSMTVQLANTTEVAMENVSIRISVFGAVGSRSALREALDAGPRSGAISSTLEQVDGTIAPGEQRTITLQRTAQSFSAFSRTGVYPLGVTLRQSGIERTLYTALPYFASLPQSPISVTLVLPVTRAAAISPNGVYEPGAITGLRLSELAQQLNVIARRTGLAITLAPSGSLFDTIADLSDGFAERMQSGVEVSGKDSAVALEASAVLDAARRAAQAVGEIATVPYAPADLAALARRGLRADVLRQVTLGRSVVEHRLGRAPVATAFVPPGFSLDQRSAATLGPLGIGGAIVNADALPEPPSSEVRPDLFGRSQPVIVRAAQPFGALIPDPPILDRLGRGDQGVLLGQALIAETASAWLELPVLAPERVITIAPRSLPSPTALAAALDGFASAPWVQLRTVSDAISTLTGETAPVALNRSDPPDRSYLREAREGRRALQAVASIAIQPPDELDRLNKLILIAESSEWEAAPKQGAALAAAVERRGRAMLRAVEVFSRPVTLTARTGKVPVTVINGNEFPVRVRLRLQSPKVGFPQGSTRTIEVAAGDTSVDFTVEARAAGSFPLTVRVETPDGSRLLARGTLTLRSTTVSAVALAAVGGSTVFLLAAWVRRGTRKRKRHAAG